MNAVILRNKKNIDYDVRSSKVFGKEISSNSPARDDAVSISSGTSSVPKGVRPCEHAAGAHIFLDGKQVVHNLLGLGNIRDPDRWLKRHKAPVAIDTGHQKRYRATDILRWAAEKFSPTESGRDALHALADTLDTSHQDTRGKEV